ncbi:MAG: pyridoxal phosphate-dependent aminotransferase, partial [Candidatus Omnitrophota bacterium]
KLICEKFKKDNNLDYAPEQVVVSCGAKHSIFNCLMALVSREDEVLVPLPFWVSYPEMVNICGGVVRFVKTTPKNNFKFTIKEIEKHLSPKTKVLILNSPSNPSGCVYAPGELKEIARLCVENKIFVISDEIYEKIIFDGQKPVSIASLNSQIYELAITVNGLSKSYSMTGWRIGYLGGPRDIVDAISNLQDHSTSNPASISQKAAVAALSAPDDFSKAICAEFQKRRDYLISRLKEIKDISYTIPAGAFYIFCDISKTGLDSMAFAEKALAEASVSLIPGKSFGMDDYVRISFATGIEEIEKGVSRIKLWLDKI